MFLKSRYAPAGSSRAHKAQVWHPTLTKNLITGEVCLTFTERETGKMTTVHMTEAEARTLATDIMNAADGRFTVHLREDQ